LTSFILQGINTALLRGGKTKDMTTKGRKKAGRAVYPLIAFRPNTKLENRLRKFSQKHKMPMSQIIRHCLMKQLPEMEAEYNV
jgi:hypothetical protein